MDGFAEHTAWIGSDDAFLAFDANENGIIDDLSELFGGSEAVPFALQVQSILLSIGVPSAWLEIAQSALSTNVLAGSDGNDFPFGSQGSDTIIAGSGNDVLYGREGDDTLIGGTSNDTMYGGFGNDIYIVDPVDDIVIENASEGVDEVPTSLSSYILGAYVENLTASTASALIGFGNSHDNVITGSSGVRSRCLRLHLWNWLFLR